MTDIENYRDILTGAVELSGTHSFADIERGLETGEFQLWGGTHSAIVTQVQQYPQQKVLCVFAAAGVLEELKLMWPVVRDWGRQQGCEKAFLVGRAGWARSFLVAEGWKLSAIVMETEL